MGLFDRFLKVIRAPSDGKKSQASSNSQDATHMLEEGMALEKQGQLEEALQRYEAAIRLMPELARAHFNRGNILLDRGDAASALGAYAKAMEFKPDSAALHYNMGNANLRLGNPEVGVASYRQAITLKPDFADAHMSLGLALGGLGQHEGAVECFSRLVELKPDSADAHYQRGIAFHDLGSFSDAVKSYRRALEIDSGVAAIHSNLGCSLKELGLFDDAISSYNRALEINPDLAVAHNNLSVVFKNTMRLDDAYLCGLQAIRIKPDFADAYANLGGILRDMGRFEESRKALQRALEIDSDCAIAHNNLLFIHNYVADQPAALLLADAQRFGDMATRMARPFAAWPNPPDPDRCLRVGLVSGDLCSHPVGYFLESVLFLLISQAPLRLELFAYATSFREDDTSRRLRACCRVWRSVLGLSDERLAQQIHYDGIDILIDLAGHTEHNRLPVFAWRPAPVQATWLGYFATTGVAEIDYLIADLWTLPPSEEPKFTERIWRLPETRLCFTPPNFDLGSNTALPALDNGYVTFACFNNLAKVNDAVVALWARILIAVPGSRLFFIAPQLRDTTVKENLVTRFGGYGIVSKRLVLLASVPRVDYLATYQRVDIALDPFPYPGGTTTVEALWMGIPVLSLAGERFLSRQGVGLLMNAGLPEWVAADPDDYVARAISHAGDLHALALLRAGLRQQVLATPIFDAPRFAQHFEAALRGMWRKWCDQGSGVTP